MQVSKGLWPSPTAISSIDRRSSILQISDHSCGVNDTEVLELFCVNTGTSRVEGMRLESTCHSSMRRAPSMIRLPRSIEIVTACCGRCVSCVNANEPPSHTNES